MRALLLTDNRFWRESMGSQVRISELAAFLADQLEHLQLFFVGSPTEQDITQALTWAERWPGRVDIVFTEGCQLAPSAGAAAAARPPLRARLRRLVGRWRDHLNYLRRLRRLPALAPGAMPAQHAARLHLALREPSLADLERSSARQGLRAWCETLPSEDWPQLVLVEYLRLAYLLDELPPRMRQQTHCVVDTHDIQSERRQRFHAADRVHDLKIEAREEARALGRFDTVLAIQARDAQLARQLLEARPPQLVERRTAVLVVPHPVRAVDSATELPTAEALNPLKLLFLGSDMEPNVIAAQRLLRSIWPSLPPAARACMQLSLAGSVCKAIPAEDLPENVRLLGHVAELQTLFAEHQVFVSPIDIGGGLKIKNVEALGAGLALVTTDCGAEGLEAGLDPAREGQAFRLAASDAEFVSVLREWLEDRAALQVQRLRGLTFARSSFGRAAVYAPLAELLSTPNAHPAQHARISS